VQHALDVPSKICMLIALLEANSKIALSPPLWRLILSLV